MLLASTLTSESTFSKLSFILPLKTKWLQLCIQSLGLLTVRKDLDLKFAPKEGCHKMWASYLWQEPRILQEKHLLSDTPAPQVNFRDI